LEREGAFGLVARLWSAELGAAAFPVARDRVAIFSPTDREQPIPRRLRTDHTRIGKAPRGARCRMDGHSRGRAPATGARCRAVAAASSRGKGCRMHMAWRHGVSAFREGWTKRSRWSGGRPCRGKRRPGRAGALPRLLCTHSSPNQSPWPPQGQRRARYTGSLPVRAGTGRAWRSLTIRSLLCGAILGAESS